MRAARVLRWIPRALVLLGLGSCARAPSPPATGGRGVGIPAPPATFDTLRTVELPPSDSTLRDGARWPIAQPTLDSGGEVLWIRYVPDPRAGLPAAAAAENGAPSLQALIAGATASDSLTRAAFLQAVAYRYVSVRDMAHADSAWALLAVAPGPWAWDAVRGRVEVSLARGDTARADALLAGAIRADWTEAEQASWAARRISTLMALRDTTPALGLCRQTIRDYAGTIQALRALQRLEEILEARGEHPTLDDLRWAAEVEWEQGRASAATVRLAQAIAAAPPDRQAALGLRRAELLRLGGRTDDATLAIAAALRAATVDSVRALCLLEQARIQLAAGRFEPALATFALAANTDYAPARGQATWSRARALEQRGEWRRARDDYARLAGGSGARADEARFRAGLMELLLDRPQQALTWWEGDASEGALFWRGVVLRQLDRARGDSLLARLATLPGYAFYRSAARDTLTIRGWPGALRVPPSIGRPGGALGSARALLQAGLRDDAITLLQRWWGRDRRLRSFGPDPQDPDALLEAARIAFAAQRPGFAIALADRAVLSFPASAGSPAWSAAPWVFPPTHDSLFSAAATAIADTAREKAMLQAVAWKESKFDARARSRSDALGLMQLKLATAAEQARLLGRSRPEERDLFDPALNLRLGAYYLERLEQRFGGRLPVALAAYNAGPTRARGWHAIPSRWGEALICELIEVPETHDYVKQILAVRQAYRELRPRAER